MSLVVRLSRENPDPYRPLPEPPAQRDDEADELELVLALELQAALMPANTQTRCADYHAAARNRMCGRVGGDFCEFIRLNEDQVAAAVGDVAGCGVRASLLMARIMGFLRTRPPECSRPSRIVRQVNEILLDLGDRLGAPMNCSMFYMVLDAPTASAFFVNAGLPFAILTERISGLSIRLGPVIQPLGMTDFRPAEECHTFSPSQRLTVCTDGIIDAVNANGEPFGIDRLENILGNCTQTSSNGCVQAIFHAVDAFRRNARQRDDETVLVVDRL